MTDPTAETGPRSAAQVATPNASRYLQQLCKHFAHKIPASCDAQQGRVEFPFGECRLAAAEGALALTLAAPDAAQLAQLEDVIARHLLRFAFREELRIEWQPA